MLSMEVVYGICLGLLRFINLFIFIIENIVIYIELYLQNCLQIVFIFKIIENC